MNLPGHSNHCRCSECSHPGVPGHSPLLHLCDIDFRRDGRTVLSNINFTVDRGDFIAITGPNGGGKTTLLRIVLGLLQPNNGRVVFCNSDGHPTSVRPAIGYLPQKNSVDSHFPITVSEVVASAFIKHKEMPKSQRETEIVRLLSLVGMDSLAWRPIGELSGGQLQRTLFARAIACKPELLVLDEPLSYLDKTFEQKLYDIIAELAPHTTILLVSHEMSRIGGMANRHLLVDHTIDECTASCHYTRQEC